jgi:localization factor PodJL
MAEDLARRSGMSLNEWLNRLMADQAVEDATSHDYFAPSSSSFLEASRPAAAPRIEAAAQPSEDVVRVAQALERLTDRIESAEGRQALAIAGVERSVREVISRIDSGEREQMQMAARFEGSLQEVQEEQGRISERLRRAELENEGPRSSEALRALEGSIGKVAGHLYETERRSREAFMEVAARIERSDQSGQLTASALRELQNTFSTLDARLGSVAAGANEGVARLAADLSARAEQTGQITTNAIRELQTTCSALDQRLGSVEAGANESIGRVAADLSARVEATRDELAQRLAATADARFDRMEQALAEMTDHVRAAEQRQASALERMGREVLEVAQTLNRRVQTVESRGAEAAERVGADIARIAGAVENRLAQADSIQAQALEKLGGEIARITERLADRIASAERRSAQAIDDVGEQVARVTERISQRQERSSSELAERIRQSEERTAKLLEEARQKIDARLAEVHSRPVEPFLRPSARYEEVDDALFADAPFPAYEIQTPAEQPFIRPTSPVVSPLTGQPLTPPLPATAFAPPPRPEPPAFEDEDFAAVEAFAAPVVDDPDLAAPVEASEDAGDFSGDAAGDVTGEETAVVLEDVDLGAVELEPNVGFDMDEAPAEATVLSPVERFDALAEATVFSPADMLHAEEAATDDAPPEMAEHETDDEPAHEAEPALDAEPAHPLTTREIIERARANARANAERDRASARGASRRSDESVLNSLSFGRPRQRPGGVTGALMVAGLLAAVSVAAGGYVVLEGQPQGALPKPVADALAMVRGQGSTAPMAAVALSPTPDAAPAAAPNGADQAAAYAAAVAKVGAGDPGGAAAVRHMADQGYAPAQFFLSKLYEDGKAGLKADPIQARAWTERAAEGGDRAAMHNLALDYFEGVGGPRSAASAAEWFRRAAELGLLDSQFNLAGLYEHGQGVTQNVAEAYKWYLIAAHAGDAEAQASALRVRADLTPEARAVAERAAAAFAPTAPAASAQAAAAAPSPDLMTAQRALSQLGYYQGPTDGVGSPALHLAIAAYQRDQGLTVSGSPDSATLGKLAVYTR